MSVAPEDFRFVAELVHERCAIRIEPGKEYLVDTRLHPLAKRRGLAGTAELVAALREGRDPELVRSVLEAMTTNETSFFRDRTPFEHLRRSVLPALIEARRPQRRLAIWSAAASSGQEAYSVAMLLREHFPELAGWSVSILATDLSRAMVERGRSATYTQLEVNRGLPAPYLVRHFRRSGLDWQLEESLRALVEWRELNLAEPSWPELGPFDVVLLRNVMIYFDVPAKRRILAQVRRTLRPDGALFLGTAETTIQLDEGYAVDSLTTACYRLEAA